MTMLPWLLLLLSLVDPQTRAQRPASAPPAPRNTFFTSTLPASELQNKQAVLDTSEGTIVMDLLPDAAPNHVAHFITRAREGAYNGTTFHRVIAMGIVQGGDPLSTDPSQSAKYGSGGLNQLRFEAIATAPATSSSSPSPISQRSTASTPCSRGSSRVSTWRRRFRLRRRRTRCLMRGSRSER
jgi:peptidylprolyl isomerase